jgi:Mg-chelatase subunit ChlD
MALALPFASPAEAQGPQNISVVLIIDNSGSMGRTDPAALRFVAASQLVDLLEEGDEISVILFADDSTVLVPLTKVTDAASKEAVKTGLAPVVPADNTNMRAGLEAGLAELDKGTAPVRIGIFLTDGELHPPDWPDLSAEEQAAERTAVLALADTLGEKGWGLFPISLASAAEPEFLQQLAEGGAGLYHEAPLAGDLTLVFQEIFAASKLDVFEVLFSDCLAPGEQSSLTFPVHQFVSTLSLFVTYTGDLRPAVTVTGPDGLSVSPTGGDARYDAFSIDGPARGTWTVAITGAAEGESCVSISSTPRTLVEVEWLRPLPSIDLSPGEPLEVAVRLTARDPQSGDELPVDDASVTVTVVGPNEKSYQAVLDPAGPGEYSGAVEVDGVEGLYGITLVAETEEGEVARRSLESSVSPAPAEVPSPSATPGTTPVPSPDGPDGGGGLPLALIALAPVLLVGLAGSFAAYSHFGRPVLTGWLVSSAPQRAYGLESRHRRIWTRRALTIGGPDDDIDLGLDKGSARIIPRRGGQCLLQAGSREDVVVDRHSLRRGQRRPLRHLSQIEMGGVTLEYRLYAGGPRLGV